MARINWTQGSLGATIGEWKEEGNILSTGIQRATNRVQPRLTCPLCNELFVDPHTTIRCGHTFCLSCYHQWALSGAVRGRPFPCAVCSTPFVHLAPDWVINDLVHFHMNTLEVNQTPGWFGPSAEMRAAYEYRVMAWNTRKAGIRELFTHPEELVSLVPMEPVKPIS